MTLSSITKARPVVRLSSLVKSPGQWPVSPFGQQDCRLREMVEIDYTTARRDGLVKSTGFPAFDYCE